MNLWALLLVSLSVASATAQVVTPYWTDTNKGPVTFVLVMSQTSRGTNDLYDNPLLVLDVGTNTSMSFSNLTWGSTYYFGVKSVVSNKQSKFSSELVVPVNWKGQRVVTMGTASVGGPWVDLPKLTRTNIVWPANGEVPMQVWKLRVETLH